jgi:hypothetical protein
MTWSGCEATPGPTKPTQVWPISFWMSPWFHANAGLMQVSQVDVGKSVMK